jgi:threonine/homoserine/homoserine lactone efflux protein
VTADLYLALATNTILLASGVNFGFRRTLPMIFAVALGFPLMIGVVGLGLGRVFEVYPVLYTLLKYAGSAYMIWLAWKIATGAPAGEDDNSAAKPMTFIQGALFQWVNPKAWVIAVTVISAYTVAAQFYTGLAAVTLTFVVMGLTSACCWAMFGVGLRHVLNDPRYFRVINVALAISLVISIALMLRH